MQNSTDSTGGPANLPVLEHSSPDQRQAIPVVRDFVDVVFDGPPGHEAGRFVEVEDSRGHSINAGEWIDRGDGMWALRIAQSPAARPSTEPALLRVAKALTALAEALPDVHYVTVGVRSGRARPSITIAPSDWLRSTSSMSS
jgi:hypothetical protein